MTVDKEDSSEQIFFNIPVLYNGTVTRFKIKKHTPLKYLMKIFCERNGLDIRRVRFRFNGQGISEADTPSSLNIQEDDTIYVLREQLGGCFYFNYF